MAAGLDCETDYDFRVSVRGSGDTRNDGDRYPSAVFGSTATTSARTGECAQAERVTNLLVSIEPGCATLTWSPPSGDRDTGYRVEHYSYTGNRSQRSETETLVEQANRVADRYQDCSAAYRTGSAEHVYVVTALDNDPEPDEDGAFGSAYTSTLVYGPGWVPEGPLNVRLTLDTRFIRQLEWDAPRDPWLSTVRTARAGSGPQQVVTDPWTTGYRVERREYVVGAGGDWYLPEQDPIWSATMTVGSSTTGTPAKGYFGVGSNTFGAVTPSAFTHPVGSGSWTVNGLLVTAGKLRLAIEEVGAPSDDLPHSAFEDWVIVVDGRSFPFELPEGVISGNLTVDWANPGLNWANGQRVSIQLVERIVWETLRDETDGDAGTSFTDATDKGDRQYVYRVWPHNDRGLTHYSYRGDWAFNGGDPGGYPVQAPQPQFWQVPQLEGETPSNNPATGHPTIGGTPQVDQTLTADTSNIADQDGLTTVSYNYQWIAGGTDIDGATGASYTLTASEQGQTIQVRVTFTDDADNEETLTSEATETVAAKPNTAPTGQPTIGGTPLVEETLTADTANIADQDGLTNVSYRYQWIAGGSDIGGATGSTYTLTASEQGQSIQVRVTFTDAAGNEETLTSIATAAVAAAEPLTASLPGSRFQSARHKGADDRPQVIVAFSLTVASFPKTTPSVSLTGATVSSVRQHEEDGLKNAWIFFLDPDGTDDIVFNLLTGQPCDSGGICTEDGRTLSLGVQVILPGPDDPNSPATGAPTIGGTPQVEETLTASTSDITDRDGLTNVSYGYQWIAGGTDIDGATGSSYQLTSTEQGQTVQVRVTFTDDRNNSESLTSAATKAVAAKPVPLTATFSNVPASHSGSGEFTFDLAFSENLELSYITLRDHALTEDDHGPVTKAQRKVQGSNQTWTITIEPKGNGAITITLPATTDCAAPGAICTSDGRKLSNLTTIVVPGT